MSQPAAIKKLYDEGMREVFRIVGSFESTPEQLEVANQTAVDLTALLVKHTLATIDGRTALLAGLIVELNQVIATIQTEPPYAGALRNFTRIAAQAQKLFAGDVKSLT